MTGGRRTAVLVVLILVLAAVSVATAALRTDDEPTGVAVDEAVTNAYRDTLSAGAAGIAFFFRVEDLPGELGLPSVAGEGRLDLAGGGAAVTLEISEALAGFSGATAGRVDLVDDGTDAFVRAPGEDRWRPVDPAARRTSGGGFDLIAGTDVGAGLAFVADATVAAEPDGEDLVRGRLAKRFEVTLDPGAVEEGSRGASIAEQLEAVGFDELFAYVWIDEDGRVARVRYDADLARLQGGGPFGAGGRFVTELELFDYGVDLDAERPPEREVEGAPVDLAELEALLGGLGI